MKKALLIAMLYCGMAHAEFKDGNKLYEQINSGKDSDWFVVIGYIMGVADAGQGTVSCPPSTVTAGQLFDMVKQQLEKFPAGRHFSGDVIVNYTLSKTWPCAKKGTAL